MYLLILTEMLLASTWTIGKAALRYLNPIFFVGLRMTIAGAILLSWLYFFKRDKFYIKKEHWFLFLQIIIFHIYITYVFEFWALKYLSSFKTAFFYNLAPFIAAFFGYFFLSEKMNLKKWIGLLVGFTGIMWVLVSEQTPQEIGKDAFYFLSWPEIAIIIGVASAVYGWVVFKKLCDVGKYSPIMINGVAMLFAGVMALITSFYMESSSCCNSQSFFEMSSENIFAALGDTFLLIILANIIAYNLYGYLLKRYSITFLSFAGTIAPFFVALFGFVFLGEIPSLTIFLASILVVIGLYVFYMQELKLKI